MLTVLGFMKVFRVGWVEREHSRLSSSLFKPESLGFLSFVNSGLPHEISLENTFLLLKKKKSIIHCISCLISLLEMSPVLNGLQV